jgi:hypothetical protein
MLSRKQLWRKTKVYQSNSNRQREESNTGKEKNSLNDSESDNNSIMGSEIQPTIMPTPPVKKLRSALNLMNLLSVSERALRPKDNRTMRFSSTVHICLIPSRPEMKGIST